MNKNLKSRRQTQYKYYIRCKQLCLMTTVYWPVLASFFNLWISNDTEVVLKFSRQILMIFNWKTVDLEEVIDNSANTNYIIYVSEFRQSGDLHEFQ